MYKKFVAVLAKKIRPQIFYYSSVSSIVSLEKVAHLNQIDQEVTEQVEVLMKQMAEKQGVNENLKRQDQMKWVGLMNKVEASAEEIVLKERVYM